MKAVLHEPAVAIGADLVEVRRVARLLSRYGKRFSDRVFTAAELSDCAGRAESLAARWAAKEAVAKALGIGLGRIGPQEVEVVRGRAGQPELRLSGRAKALAASCGLRAWAVSLSHDGGMALAFVVALRLSAAVENAGEE